MTRNLDEDEKGTHNVRTLGGEQALSIISESGLYNAIFRSRREEAKAFRRWVTGTVLPELRRTGRYALAAPSCAAIDITSADARHALAAVRLMRDLRGNVAAFDLWRDLGLPTPDSARGDTIAVDGLDAAIADWAAGRDIFTSDELAADLGLASPDLKLRTRMGSVLRLLGFESIKMRRNGGQCRAWVRRRPTPIATIIPATGAAQ
jgi:hypothetical protein